jgi:SpoVK/Ycf46/Vps4 family AAA+-type ATPase
MSFLADKKREHEQAAEKALADKDYAKAMFHTAKAAEFGLKLAEQSEGKVAKKYVEDAFELIGIAEQLRGKAAAPPEKKASGAARPAAKEPGDDREDASSQWLLTDPPDVSFSDIIGLEELKERIKRFIIKFKHPEEVAKWPGARLGDRMILYGPPGTGKTMFAKAIAKEIEASFFQVKGSNLLDKWVGESQKNVKRLFDSVRQHERTVVFLDELDGILSKRGSSSTVRDSVVSEFLQEMEGIASPNTAVLFIGATNLPSALDAAVISRFGGMFYLPLPPTEARLALLKREFDAFPYGYEDDISLDDLAEKLEGHSMRSITTLLAVLRDIGITKAAASEGHRFTREDVETAWRDLPAPLSAKEIAKYERFASGAG